MTARERLTMPLNGFWRGAWYVLLTVMVLLLGYLTWAPRMNAAKIDKLYDVVYDLNARMCVEEAATATVTEDLRSLDKKVDAILIHFSIKVE